MNNILQFVGTFASVFSIPLAIILFFKTNDARQNKIRLEIIRSLSYRIGEGKSLDKIEVSAVYNSKMREHNIKKSFFSEKTILEDIIADVISNPFLTSDQKTIVIENIRKTLEIYKTLENKVEQKTESDLEREKIFVYRSEKKYGVTINIFSIIAILLSFIVTATEPILGEHFAEFFSNIQFPVEVFISIGVTIFSSISAVFLALLMKKIIKKG